MAKDLGLANAAASSSQSAIKLGDLASQIYQQMLKEGYSGKDFSSVYQWLSEHSGAGKQ